MTIENMKSACEEYKSSVTGLSENSELLESEIPIELISNKGKLVTLISNEGDSNAISVKNSTVKIKLKEIFFCSEITIKVQSGQSLRGVKITATNPLFGNEVRFNSETQSSGDHIRYTIRSFISEISITPPESIFTSKNINKIKITGKSIKELIELEGAVKEFIQKAEWISDKDEELKCRANDYISNAENKKIEHENEINSLISKIENSRKTHLNAISELEAINNSIANSTLEKNKIEDGIIRATSELHSIEARNELVSSTYSKTQSDLSSLNTEINEKSKKLRALNEDVNLFTEDFRSYISQTRTQEIVYGCILALPILAICAIAYQLLSGAVDLTFKYQKENIDIFALFSSRMPYVFTVIAIVTAATKIIQIFGGELISLHEGRRNLAQISIIARDVSDAEGNQAELSKNEIYDRRMALKMDLLKSHISGMLKEYKYKSVKKFDVAKTNTPEHGATKQEYTEI